MKTYKFLFLLILSAACMVSCDKDILETVPNDRISNDAFWNTEEDARLGANAAYRWLDGTNIFMWDAISDLGHVNQYNAFVNDLVTGVHDASTPMFANEWENAYGGIYAANRFLAEVDRVEMADPENIAAMKGEMRTLRAWYYIRLVSLYGGVPLVTEPIDLETGRSLTRENAETIWNFIELELTAAAADLPATRPASEAGMITKGAALALKARAMLYNAEYRKAADAAKEVMDLGVYSLYPSYQNLFSYEAESNSEVIMEKGFLAGTYSNSVFNLMAPYSQKSSQNWYVPTQALVDMYQTDQGLDITDPESNYSVFDPYTDRDPRLRYSLIVAQDELPSGRFFPGPFSGSPDAINSTFRASRTGYTLRKYVNFEDYDTPTNNGINIILLRYAEVLLTYAEAKIELGEIDNSVVDAINMVRQRPDVDMPPIEMGLGQQEMREIVRNERAVELAFEGLRYFDIRRWGIAEDVLNGKVYGFLRNGVPSELPSFERRFRADRDYLWPIPLDEILLNPNLEQNPGY